MIHARRCDETLLDDSPHSDVNVLLMDSIYRDIQLRNAKCKPSEKEGNKYLDCSGSWKEKKEMIARKLGFHYWIRIFALDVSKNLTEIALSFLLCYFSFFLERDCFGSCILKMQI